MKTTYTIILAVIFTSCGTPRQSPEITEALHLTLAWDASDRVSRTDQARRDSLWLHVLLDEFSRTLNNARFTFHVIEQDSSFIEGLAIQPLQIETTGMTPVDARKERRERAAEIRSVFDDLQTEASQFRQYFGAKTWLFLQGLHLPEQTPSGQSIRHLVLLLSDGYHLARQNYALGTQSTHMSKEALVQARSCVQEDIDTISLAPPRTDLAHVFVAVVEMRPRVDHPCEAKILQEVNERWLRSMGVIDYAIIFSQSDAGSIRDIAQSLINQADGGTDR